MYFSLVNMDRREHIKQVKFNPRRYMTYAFKSESYRLQSKMPEKS